MKKFMFTGKVYDETALDSLTKDVDDFFKAGNIDIHSSATVEDGVLSVNIPLTLKKHSGGYPFVFLELLVGIGNTSNFPTGGLCPSVLLLPLMEIDDDYRYAAMKAGIARPGHVKEIIVDDAKGITYTIG